MRPALVAACATVASLAWASATAAHVLPQPQFLATGGTATLLLAGPNERDETMTGFSVTVPDGLRIVHARDTGQWEASVNGSTATWAGGGLEPLVEETFELHLDVSATPGLVTLETEQRYPGDETVRWPVSLTIVPGSEDAAQNLGWALVAALVGLLLTAAIVALAWRRRSGPLQER